MGMEKVTPCLILGADGEEGEGKGEEKGELSSGFSVSDHQVRLITHQR